MKTVARPCPLCSQLVQTNERRTVPPNLYTCPQCGAGLWLITGTLGYRLVVAHAGVRI
ncbi:hypothetical protein [uncultured Methanomethylovorans sp.]|uniref:hypothetical protein n=1 Tax=uncultured Methanomethylovorans sp. TaxID=183759 RepID=UPI002AA75E10|nr:hypothetical protein [uncultured Methanomethylovorans sp.]